MKKKLNLLKNFVLLIACTILLTGCASMSYIGSDYDAQNTGNVQTSAGFYFQTYKKYSNTDNVEMKVGITKSTIPDVFIVYIDVYNKNNEDFVLYQKDFSYLSDDRRARIISTSEYINAFQSQETGTYASMQNLAPTISNIAKIQNNFQPLEQENTVYQQNTRDNLSSQIGWVSQDVASHALNSAVSVGANSKKYYYNFIQADDPSVITVKYKDLEYKFGQKKKNNSEE